jgi:tripartite-type tricarboxylate transporter receptor subunit TctC
VSFAPAIPTFREAGMKIDADGWNTFFAPSTMPPAKVQLLATAIREVMQDPALQKAANASYITPIVSTQAETVQMLKAFRQQWEPVVRRSGFQP